MSRFLTVSGAQLGPIAREETRSEVVARMTSLLHQAKTRGCDLVVFPELALTTFFPRWWVDDDAEMDAFFEREMPSGATQPLFDEAKALGLGFYLGFAELVSGRHYNHIHPRRRGWQFRRQIPQSSSTGTTVVGHKKRDRTPSKLWPSDHGGVIARFDIR